MKLSLVLEYYSLKDELTAGQIDLSNKKWKRFNILTVMFNRYERSIINLGRPFNLLQNEFSNTKNQLSC